MPVATAHQGGKWRVVEVATGDVAKNKSGTAVDGGGFASKVEAARQVAAINIAKMRQHHDPRAPRKL